MSSDKEFVVHNPETGSGYPLASLVSGEWSVSSSFNPEEFTMWLEQQGGEPLLVDYTEPMKIAYTASCPNCEEPVSLNPKIDSDLHEFECEMCGEKSDVDLNGDDDEE
jgi:hypothetical protein